MEENKLNPYSSPVEVEQSTCEKRSLAWQQAVAFGFKGVPFAFGYHLVVPILNYFIMRHDWEIAGGIAGFFMWLICLAYSGWFASLLYGRLLGSLIALLAAFPMVGLLAVAMYSVRATRELRAYGWKVQLFSLVPAEATE